MYCTSLRTANLCVSQLRQVTTPKLLIVDGWPNPQPKCPGRQVVCHLRSIAGASCVSSSSTALQTGINKQPTQWSDGSPNLFVSAFLGGSLPNYTQTRCYMKKKTLKILPTKPLSFDYAGDVTTENYPLDLSEPKVELQGAEKLNSVNETIQKLLTVEFGDGHDKQKRRVHNILAKVREHPLDVKSQEVLIAYQTVALRNQMKHVMEFRKDKAAKSLLIMRIQARRKHMKRLRSLDMERFLWLCEELKIKYIPIPQYHRKESKRALLKRTAKEAALLVKKEKMRVFREQLEKEKQEFLVHKDRELADIEKQLEGLSLDPDSYLGKFYRALKEGKPEYVYEKPEHPKSRREMILTRKFKLAEQRALERQQEI